MFKKITFSDEMKKKIYKGAHTVAEVVGSTLGPAGQTVIIERGYSPLISRDGITVAKAISLEDAEENLGAQLITKIGQTQDTESCGDGTSTATVLADAILTEGLKSIDKGVSPIKLKNGIFQAVDDVVEELKKITVDVETEEQITQVASISANNDRELGELISKAISMAGTSGVVTTGESSTGETTLDFVEGMSFDNGYLSPYFCTDKENFICDFKDCLILMTDRVISNAESIVGILSEVSRKSRPLLIIAENIEGEALTTLILNNMRGTVKVCAIKSPGFGDRKKAMLEDIAILTGGQVISEDLGLSLETTTFSDLGFASSIKITRDNTTILGGGGDKDIIQKRVSLINKQISEATSEYDKEKLQERLARLDGGIAVIKVGDISETALKEKKFRVEDALNATRSAIDEGIVSGGGTALCQISKKLSKVSLSDKYDSDFIRGYNIVLNALTSPIKKISENAGLSGEVVADKVANSPEGVGFNALTGEYVNMIEDGVIDPVKVTRLALQNASSVATLILTSSCSITDIPEKEDAMNGMMPV